MVPDCLPLRVRQLETEALEDGHAAVPVALSALAVGLAEVVEEGDDRDTVGWEQQSRVRHHMVVYLNGVLRKPSDFLVMLVARTSEVVRRFEIVDDGFDAGAPGGAENAEDSVFDVFHTTSYTTIAKRSFRCDSV